MILRRQVILQNETRLGACGWRRGTLVGQVLSQQPATNNVNQPRDRRIESQRDQKEEYVDTRHKQHPTLHSSCANFADLARMQGKLTQDA